MSVDLKDYDPESIATAVDSLNGLCAELAKLRPETRETIVLQAYPDEWMKFAQLAGMLSALFSETPGDPIPIAAEVVAAAPRKDSLRLPGQLDFQDVSTSEFDWFIWRGQSTSGEHYIKRVHHDGRQFLWSAPVEDWNNSVAITDSRWIGK